MVISSLSVSTVAHPPAVQACCLGEEANKKGVGKGRKKEV